MEDPYKMLGISPEAQINEIKQAYRKLSLKYHPDRNPGDNGDMFKKITTAYELLSDDKKRKDYNTMKKMGIPIDEHMFQNSEVIDPNDILNMLFSGTTGGMPGLGSLGGLFSMGMPPGMTGGPGLGHNDWKEFNPFKEMGAKVHVFGPGVNVNSSQIIPPISKSAEITLEQAYNGCSIGVEIKRQITYYNDNTTETEKVYFDIPEGADDNEIISIKEKGHVYNGNKGDVQVFIKIKTHENIERIGMDLIYNKSITFKDSLCGFSFDLKHINGQTYKINNREGNIIPQYHEKNVANLGMKRNGNAGSLVIKFNVDYPEQLSKEQIDTFKNTL